MAVRIAGLVLFVFTISKLPVHTMAYTIRPEYGILSYSLPSAIPIFVGIMLFIFPGKVSGPIVNSIPSEYKVDKPKDILYVGCVLTGVAFLFFSLSDLVFHISTALILNFSPAYELSLQIFDYPSAIATLIEFAFALLLIFRSRRLLNIVFRYSK